MREADGTKILGWPEYRVYRQEINEEAKMLKLWVTAEMGKSQAGVFGLSSGLPLI
jgi:hypothetical protein